MFLVVPRGQSLCSQSGDSLFPSHIYSGFLMWRLLKPMGSFPLTSPSRGAARTFGEGLGETARLHHSSGAVTALANPRAISNYPSEPLYNAVENVLGAEMLWEHCDFKRTWNFLIPKSHEAAAFLVLGFVPLCLAGLYFCPAHAGMMEARCLEPSASHALARIFLLLPWKWGRFSWRTPVWVGLDCLRSWSWVRRETNVSKEKIPSLFYPEIQVDPLAKNAAIQHQVVSWHFFCVIRLWKIQILFPTATPKRALAADHSWDEIQMMDSSNFFLSTNFFSVCI